MRHIANRHIVREPAPEAAPAPLTEATFFILLSLAPGPRHGYAIMKEVAALSGRRVVLSTGTLYGALKRLLELAWIVRVPDPDPQATARPRQAYALTRVGRRTLQAETLRLKSLVAAARRRGAPDQA